MQFVDHVESVYATQATAGVDLGLHPDDLVDTFATPDEQYFLAADVAWADERRPELAELLHAQSVPSVAPCRAVFAWTGPSATREGRFFVVEDQLWFVSHAELFDYRAMSAGLGFHPGERLVRESAARLTAQRRAALAALRGVAF